jgi:hypothetical protein
MPPHLWSVARARKVKELFGIYCKLHKQKRNKRKNSLDVFVGSIDSTSIEFKITSSCKKGNLIWYTSLLFIYVVVLEFVFLCHAYASIW